MNVPFKSPQPELGVEVLALDEVGVEVLALGEVEVVTVVEPAVSLDVEGAVIAAVELLASSNVAWKPVVFLAVAGPSAGSFGGRECARGAPLRTLNLVCSLYQRTSFRVFVTLQTIVKSGTRCAFARPADSM